MGDVSDRVRRIVAEHIGIDATRVTGDAAFIEDLGADSLDAVELAMLFEVEFNCEIPDAWAAKISTVNDAVALIGARLNGNC